VSAARCIGETNGNISEMIAHTGSGAVMALIHLLIHPLYTSFTYLLSFLFTRIGPFRFQAGGRKRRDRTNNNKIVTHYSHSPSTTPLATAVIFSPKNNNISAMPSWPSSKSFEQTFEVISQ